MVTDGSYVCVEHRIMYGLLKSLCCTSATNVTLCANYTSIGKKKKEVWCISGGSCSDQCPNRTKSSLWFYSSMTKSVANTGSFKGWWWCLRECKLTNSSVLSKEEARSPLKSTRLHRGRLEPPSWALQRTTFRGVTFVSSLHSLVVLLYYLFNSVGETST